MNLIEVPERRRTFVRCDDFLDIISSDRKRHSDIIQNSGGLIIYLYDIVLLKACKSIPEVMREMTRDFDCQHAL